MLEQTRHQPSNPFPTLTSLIVLFLLGIYPPTICLIETKSNKSYEVPGYKEVVMRARRDDGRDESKGHPNKEHLTSNEMIWYKLVWNVTLKIFQLLSFDHLIP